MVTLFITLQFAVFGEGELVKQKKKKSNNSPISFDMFLMLICVQNMSFVFKRWNMFYF